ncbi:hypothetical protein BN1708_020028, partial [Verticillium longisporum]
HGSPPAPPS